MVLLFKTKERIRSSFVISIMISLKDRVVEYGKYFTQLFQYQGTPLIKPTVDSADAVVAVIAGQEAEILKMT